MASKSDALSLVAMFNWSFDTQGQLRAGLFISLVSVWLLVGVFSYLNYYTRRKYFSIWTVAWLFYSLYLTLSYSLFWYYGNFRQEPWWATMFKQWCIGVAAVFMLWGSLRFLGKRVRQISLSLFLCFLFVWSFVANVPGFGPDGLDKHDRLALQMPIFILIGGASAVTVWGFMQYRRKRRYLGAGLLCFGFMFWGLFVAAYPFLESLSDYMSTGFFLASVLQMFIAVNMIILVLEQIRHLKEKHAAQQLKSTERQKADLQNRISLTEERYRSLFEQSTEPIVITTRDVLRIVGLNGAACRLLGMTPEEASKHHLTRLLTASEASTAEPPAGQSWFESVCRRRFQQVRRKDGSTVDVEVAGSAVDFAGSTAFQFYFREMTDISRLEHQLRRAEKLSAVGQMISGVVHELNNPLTVSGALLELVLMDSELSSVSRGRLKTASTEHRRACRMMNNFLNLARDGGTHQERVNLNEVVRNVLELRRSEFLKSNIEVASDLNPELPSVIASLDQVQQVVIILLNNALQAMDASTESRVLRLTTQAKPGQVTLLVEDSGPGVPPHLRCKIFEPFFTTKPAGVGTGLGLSMAHTYITEHRGRIFCEQSPLGGALFGIELPAQETLPPRPAPQISRLNLSADLPDDPASNRIARPEQNGVAV
jgi:PAS domain S-box-containing protein